MALAAAAFPDGPGTSTSRLAVGFVVFATAALAGFGARRLTATAAAECDQGKKE
ncbi:hypothetical protein [Hymenobacter sp. HDW8]|uniref:hypothetical protein n=1 Tax=Hymenobacter sp. HDW8 TaxID=2714932 RepID=UPI00140C1ED2|nr:hypothetical protein [Hymenobacter sp. HDW8]QIL78305.1 hypothetical protein G7064_21025 [Hymenobacter sp. HDW8]